MNFFNLESIITGCLPIADNGRFDGVVCADVLLSELAAEILYLKQGEFSYAFVMDGEERTLVHPLLPDPRDVIAKEQDIINIYNFETSGDIHEVIESMKKKVFFLIHVSHKVICFMKNVSSMKRFVCCNLAIH